MTTNISGREWLSPEGRFLFEKYGPAKNSKGEFAEHVAIDDPSYVAWVVGSPEVDICDDDREILASHLARKGRS